jgi:hypothetical protein
MRTILFFTWFSVHGASESVPWSGIVTALCLLAAFVIAGNYTGGTRLFDFSAFPRMLKIFLRIDITLFAIGLFGQIMNQSAEAANHGLMPVAAMSADEVSDSAVHVLAWSGTFLSLRYSRR